MPLDSKHSMLYKAIRLYSRFKKRGHLIALGFHQGAAEGVFNSASAIPHCGEGGGGGEGGGETVNACVPLI